MAPSTRTQNVIVGVLAALAVGASVLAIRSVGQPDPTPGDAAVATATVRPAGDDDAVTSTAPDDDEDTAEESETATETDDAAETETPSPSPTADEPGPSVDRWVDAWAGEADLLVIGDGFSNLPGQWLQQWAVQIGQDRPVRIQHWAEAGDVRFGNPTLLSEVEGERLSVWSASRAGATVASAADRYERFVDASTDAEAVLISLGRDSGNENIAEGMDELVGQIDEDVPVLVVVGPEDLYEDGVGDAFLDWARDNDDRVSVLDLRDVAPQEPTAEEWADALQEALDGS